MEKNRIVAQAVSELFMRQNYLIKYCDTRKISDFKDWKKRKKQRQKI